MKKSVKVTLFAVLSLVLVFGMMLFSGCGSSSSSSTPAPASTTYSGTLYMAAGDGGHIGVFPVTIDPSNTTTPITVNVNSVTKYQALTMGTTLHDVRFGVNSNGTTNYNRIYYAGMMSYASDTSTVPIGYTDLSSGAPVIKNSKIDIDAAGMDTIAFALSQVGPLEFGAGTRIAYCASGMNKDYFFPMSMSYPAYIDAIPVGALETAGGHVTSATTGFKRIYLGQIDESMNFSGTLVSTAVGTVTTENGTQIPLKNLGYPPLAFIHGASSPDGTKIFMSTNVMAGLTKAVSTAGQLRVYEVAASDISSGIVTSTSGTRNTLNVAPSNGNTSDGSLWGTIAYRASYTPDGTYILQSGSDRLLILKASDLSLYVDTAGTGTTPSGASAPKSGTTAIASGLGAGTFGGIELHDAIATKDSKYAVVSVRYYSDAAQRDLQIKTSGVQLYDINNKAFVGKVTPTCGSSATACHAAYQDFATRPTCGVIAHWN